LPKKGYKITEEHRKHLSEAHKGFKYPNGRIAWNKGLHISNSGQFRKGSPPWNKGKHPEYMKGANHPMYAKHHTIEAKVKMRMAKIEKHLSPLTEFKKGNKPTREQIRKRLHRRIPSSLEEKFQSIIDKYKLPYKYVGDGSFIIGHCNPDYINVNHEKIAIEVYARYYKLRNNKSINQWKEERSKIFRKYGWEIIYFNELEVNDSYILEVLNK